uniref:COX8A oxidase n=1 Tax=Calidris pygmaea TaxID=425635 RepID=A0A8C3JY34_9CHAR
MPFASRLAGSLLRSAVRPGPARRGIISGPPQNPLGVVGFLAMFAACLGPAAWVLAHLEEYKKRE